MIDSHIALLGWNTLILSVSAAALSVLIAAPLALLIARTDVPGRKTAAVLLATLLWIPLYLQAGAWLSGFGLQGWYSLATGLPPLLEGMHGAVWIHAMAGVPWAVLIIVLGTRWVEPEIEEEASLDASAWQVFRAITLRRSLGAIAAAALLVGVMTAGEMTVTNLLLVRTLSEEIYTQISLGEITVDGSLLWLPAVVLVGLSIAAALVVTAKLIPHMDAHAGRRPVTFRSHRRWLAGIGVWATLAILAGVPLVSLFYKSGILISREDSGWQREWSAIKSMQMVVDSADRFGREIGWTATIGATTAATALVLGCVLAWTARASRTRAALVTAGIALCWAVPAPLAGLAVIEAFNRAELPWLLWLYDRTIAAPVVAQTIRAVPLATLVLWHAFASVPRETLLSAALDGAGRWRTLVRIVLPGRKSALAIAWLIALAASFGDLAASILVVPPGVSTLAISIFGLIHYGVDDQVAGICLLLCGLFSLLAGITLKLMSIAAKNIRDSHT